MATQATGTPGGIWTVDIYDMGQAAGEKRLAQVALIYGELLPKGYTRESFAGRKAHRLDEARVAELGAFVERAMQGTKVPGVKQQPDPARAALDR